MNPEMAITSSNWEIFSLMIMLTVFFAAGYFMLKIVYSFRPGFPEYEKRMARKRQKATIQNIRDEYSRNPFSRGSEV